MLKRILIIALTSTVGMMTAPVWACSVESGYEVPTILELVEDSDAIVLAKTEAAGLFPELDIPTVKFVPVTLLKGDTLPQAIYFESAFLSSPEFKAVASDPHELIEPNPDVYTGGCTRQVFDEDMLLVVFLKKEGDEYRANAPAYTRALEDVPSSEAPWVKAVRIYIKITALPPMHRKGAMMAEMARLAELTDDPDAELLAHALAKTLHEGF